MKWVVTGAAGFIGSHLCERLIHLGYEVLGIDSFVPFYSTALKRRNLLWLQQQPRFTFHECDLRYQPVHESIHRADVIVHLAAMPGLSTNPSSFEGYLTCNVVATYRLLEAVKETQVTLKRFILGSTSSVYGKVATGDEHSPTFPISSYGVTKLAAEHLARTYVEYNVLPLVTLRFFSVYGPRQRPDMGYHQFINALLMHRPITVFGDGRQVRSNTYIDDCVSAILASVDAPTNTTYNVGGGESADVWKILSYLETISHCKADIQLAPARPSDQITTLANTSRIAMATGWKPITSLEQGLTQQFAWQKQMLQEQSKEHIYESTS